MYSIAMLEYYKIEDWFPVKFAGEAIYRRFPNHTGRYRDLQETTRCAHSSTVDG